jgi:histidinol-phosphatase
MTSPPIDDELLTFASTIAAEAAELTLEYFRRQDLGVEHKRDGSEVTEADRAAEAHLREAIAARYPGDTIIGEEAGTSGGGGQRQWIIDPIDGTSSFIRGVPLYASLLGLIDEHGPAIGIISIPALDECIVSGRGRGARHNGEPVAVSKVSSVADSCICSSSFDQRWWPRGALDAVTGSGAKTRTWGDGYGYLLVATGRIEGMLDPELRTYDIAPMLTIIPESGGRITRWDGGTELVDHAGWIATNGVIHDELLELVRA